MKSNQGKAKPIKAITPADVRRVQGAVARGNMGVVAKGSYVGRIQRRAAKMAIGGK